MLPAAMWGEKEGTYTNSERRVSKVNRAVAPPGEAKTDFEIFLGFAAALGVRDEIFPDGRSPPTPSRNGSASRPDGSATTRV
jgi:assimilatory nitrate reductase catalytic subunit